MKMKKACSRIFDYVSDNVLEHSRHDKMFISSFLKASKIMLTSRVLEVVADFLPLL